MTLFWNSSYRF